jgi:hypothetical protein
MAQSIGNAVSLEIFAYVASESSHLLSIEAIINALCDLLNRFGELDNPIQSYVTHVLFPRNVLLFVISCCFC